MDSMVERVARAIQARRVGDLADWSLVPAMVKEDYRCEARAAIEAMIEPTLAMRGQGEQAWMDRNPNDPDSDPIRDCHRAMITAALDTLDDGQVAETAGALAPSVPE